MRLVGIMLAGIFIAFFYLGIQEDRKASPPLNTPTLEGFFSSETLMPHVSYPSFFAFLPSSLGGGLLGTKGGRMWLIDRGELRPIIGTPPIVAVGEAGLFSFLPVLKADGNVDVFLSYAKPMGSQSALTLARSRLINGRMEDLHEIYTAPSAVHNINFGGGIGMLPDGTLLLAVGNRGIENDLGTDLGKIIRLTKDGHIPPNNPYRTIKGQNRVWSSGYKNPFGLLVDMTNGQVWVSDGTLGDEFYISKAHQGQNYIDPWLTWHAGGRSSFFSIYRSNSKPEWNGNLLASFQEGILWRFSAPGQANPVLLDTDHIQSVNVDSSGCIYVLRGGENGSLYRYAPSKHQTCLVW